MRVKARPQCTCRDEVQHQYPQRQLFLLPLFQHGKRFDSISICAGHFCSHYQQVFAITTTASFNDGNGGNGSSLGSTLDTVVCGLELPELSNNIQHGNHPIDTVKRENKASCFTHLMLRLLNSFDAMKEITIHTSAR